MVRHIFTALLLAVALLPSTGFASPRIVAGVNAAAACLPPSYFGVRAGLINAERFTPESPGRRSQITRIARMLRSLDAYNADAVWHDCDISDRVGVLQIWFGYLKPPDTYPPNVRCVAWEAASARQYLADRLFQLSLLAISRSDKDWGHVFGLVRAKAVKLSMNPPGKWRAQADFRAYVERYDRQVAEAEVTAVGCPTR